MEGLKQAVARIPVVGPCARTLIRFARRLKGFEGSERYWEERYRAGGDSGLGSYGKFAALKAEVLNALVEECDVESVIEFGCGDGNQLSLAEYPRYLGVDVSPTAIESCRKRFAQDGTKSFRLAGEYAGETADLALSLDVIYHLTEDEVFEAYMERLFQAARRLVVIYSSDREDDPGEPVPHVRHRRFSDWIAAHAPAWQLLRRVPNRYPFTGDETGSWSDFFVYERRT